MSAASRKIAAFGLALVAFIGSASGAGGNDANLGTDASNVSTAPSPIAYGSYTGRLSSNDQDWFAVVDPSADPRCVTLSASGTNNMTMTLRAENAGGSRTARVIVPKETTGQAAIAVSSLSRSVEGLQPSDNDPTRGDPSRPGDYAFSVQGSGLTAYMGDAGSGSDAGSTLASATPIGSGCSRGRLGLLAGVFDSSDVYSFSGKAKDRVYYSLGQSATSDVLRVALYDTSGAQVGPVITTDQLASVELPSTGSFYLTTSAMSPTSTTDYLMALILGPPDPSACRPTCVLTS